MGCTPTISLAITVGITRRITGRITRFSVAMLPALVAPAVALSAKWRRVFSKHTPILARRFPCRPSSRASLVSDHLSFKSFDISCLLEYYFSPANLRISKILSKPTSGFTSRSPVISVLSVRVVLATFLFSPSITVGRYLSYASASFRV